MTVSSSVRPVRDLIDSDDPATLRLARLAPNGVVAPTWDDPVARSASPLIGGPLGQRTRWKKRWWTPLRLLVLLWLVGSALAVGVKAPCYQQGWGNTLDSTASKDDLRYQYVRQCYSDVPWLGAAAVASPGWFFTRDAQGQQVVADASVLTSLLKDATARVIPKTRSVAENKQLYFAINAVLLLGCLLIVVVAVARISGRRRWDASLVALAPSVILAGLVSFDLWAVMATTLGLWAWSRKKPVLSGILLGVAICFTPYPVVLLVPLLILGLRAGQLTASAMTLASTALTVLVIYTPALLLSPVSWSQYFHQWRDGSAGLGSLWYAAHLQQWPWLDVADGQRLTILSTGMMVAGIALVGLLVLLAPRRPRLAQVAFLAVAVLVLTSKTYSVQHVVWLVPLAVLARPRWRDLLLWQLGEVLYFAATWLFLLATVSPDGSNRALGADAYSLAIGLHLLGLLWLMGVVIRDVWVPAADPVRRVGLDDPCGGVFDQAPDRAQREELNIPPSTASRAAAPV